MNFWTKMPYWLKKGITKNDILLIVCASIFIALLTFCNATGLGYKLYGEIPNAEYARLLDFILNIPFYIISPIYLLTNSEGGSLGVGILLTLLSPIIGFIFWFIIFYFITFLNIKIFNSQNFLVKNLATVIFFILIILGTVVYIVNGLSKYRADQTPIVLESVIPNSLPLEANVKLTGTGFSSHEMIVWLRKGDSEYGFLWGGKSTIDNELSIRIKRLLCRVAIETEKCPSFMEIKSGKYKIEIRYITNSSGLKITPPLEFEIQ
jgi:hypothetical protein